MDKEKEIEEMANVLRYVLCDDTDYCDDCAYRGYGDCENRKIASGIYEAGYRKADEVRKETAKEILLYLKATITDGLLKNHEILNALMKEYDIEVDE